MSLVLLLPRDMHLCRSSSNVPRLPSFLKMPQNPHFLLTFGKVQNPSRLSRKTTLQRPKVARTCGVLYILTSTCASRRNAQRHALFRHRKWSKPVSFLHFDLKMCFSPQRRALFRHLNFQKWSEHEVLCTFWLGNVLRATTACTFSTSRLLKVLRG